MSIWSLTYQQSVFKHYHSDKHFSEFYNLGNSNYRQRNSAQCRAELSAEWNRVKVNLFYRMRSPYGECHRNSETQFYVYVRWRQNSTGIDMEQNRVTVTLRIRDGCFRAEGKCRTFGLYCSHLANEERSDSSLSMSSTWHRGRFFSLIRCSVAGKTVPRTSD